jgi:hypothetical protein
MKIIGSELALINWQNWQYSKKWGKVKMNMPIVYQTKNFHEISSSMFFNRKIFGAYCMKGG